MNTGLLRYTYAVLLVLLGIVSGCSSPESDLKTPVPSSEVAIHATSADPFAEYWYQGKAELTSYNLEQARYGEMHDGEAVLIFVTEDFSKKKQVKLDYPSRAGDDKVSILKLNHTKNFNTGIYPYSMMTSVFTPIHRNSYPSTLKVTTSSQEWCGHTYTQFNLDKNAYSVRFYSYFESEGDQSLKLKDAVLEDEIWTLIRLAPDELPTGNIDIIPGSMYQRLSHTDFQVESATAELKEGTNDTSLMEYGLFYEDLKRSLVIHFNKEFPHEIEGWEEHHVSGFGEEAQELVTRATRNKRIQLDYWNRNRPGDEVLREELGLD